MEKILNLDADVTTFLCFVHPIVIKAIAIILIIGCSNDVNRNALSAICPSDANPKGDTKYKIRPTNNCM